MRHEIRDLQKRLGITSVYVTHDQEEALEISDRIAVMEEGRIRQTGSPVEVYDQPADRFTAGFVGKSNFVEGTVTRGRFVTASGIALPVPSAEKEGDVILCFRPENVIIVAEGDTGFPLEVAGSTYLGNAVQLSASLADGTLFTIDAKERIPRGTRISVRIEKCRFFPRRPQ